MENDLTKIEYLELLLDAETEEQKVEIIYAYLKASNPNARFKVETWLDSYRVTKTESYECEGWDKPFETSDIVLEALRFARDKHSGQHRDDGAPYFKHILDVVDILIEDGSGWDDILLAAALHDTIEDTDTTYEEICEKFGEATAKTVVLLSKVEGEPFDVYMDRIFSNEGMDFSIKWPDEKENDSHKEQEIRLNARAVKLADRLANLRDLPSCGKPEKIQRYIEETSRTFLPLKVAPSMMNKIRREIKKLSEISGDPSL